MRDEYNQPKKSFLEIVGGNPKKYAKRAIWSIALLGAFLIGKSYINDRVRIGSINQAITNASLIDYVNNSPNDILLDSCGRAEGLTEMENIDAYLSRVVIANSLQKEKRFSISRGEYYTVPRPKINRGQKVRLPDIDGDGKVGCFRDNTCGDLK